MPGRPELAELPNILAGSHDPLLDWAVRHVLQYGADAEVLAPGELREAIVERLSAL